MTEDMFIRQARLEWIEADNLAGIARCRQLRLKRAEAAHRGIQRHREHGGAR